MKQTTQKRFNYYYRLLVSSALITGGLFQLALPVFAAGTAAGASIKNTATATYTDPNDPNTPINTTSNEVTATVAKVAGITNVPAGVTDSTPGTPVLPNDVIVFDFKITNVGNDIAKFVLDGNDPIITGPGTAVTATTGSTAYDHVSYDVDYNGDGTINAGNGDLTNQTKAAVEALPLPPGAVVTAHFPVTVNLSATSGAPITAKFGDTPPNDNSAATQNQPWDGLTNQTDVYTQTPSTASTAPNGNGGTFSGVAGAPVGGGVNGEKEAAATQTQLVGANPQAFAALLKTSTYNNGGTTTAPFSDDTITYNLSLRVDNAAPTGASPTLIAADLAGTNINIGGTPTNAILVSDAVPANTFLNTAPTAPSGWSVVYSTDDPTVTNKAPNDPTVLWTGTAPTFPDTGRTIKRVGFVKQGAGVTVPKNTTITGFSFLVKFVTGSSLETTGGSVYNIGQLFGTSVGGTVDPDGPGGNAPVPKLVYDESGDQAPSNFNDDGSEGPIDPTTLQPVVTKGVADPNNDGVDANNNNTGSGSGGEDNVVNIAPPNSIFNGPVNSPFAVGPTDNNNDFTNKSSPVAANTPPGQTINPDEVTFTNTLQSPTTLTNVLLRPVGIANVTKDGAVGGPVQDLPDQTKVTLVYGTQTAVYTYDLATDQFIFTSGASITIPTLVGGTPVNYTVKIDLPPITQLSTDSTAIEKGYSVPILAFSDNGGTTGTAGDGVLNGDETFNRTIDRVYVGFLKLTKKSAVLQGTAQSAPAAADATLDTVTKTVVPGNNLIYAIEYQNVSTPSIGTGNVILNATNVVITDSGITGNGWGLNNTNGVIITSHQLGTVLNKLGSGGTSAASLLGLPTIAGTNAFFAGAAATTSVLEQTGTTQATDITKYEMTLPVPVAPGEPIRTFTFQRKVN